MERKIFVDAAEAGDEMVFERADCAFGGVSTVEAGGDELKINGFVAEERF